MPGARRRRTCHYRRVNVSPPLEQRLRIAQVAPPFEPVPPRGYGGTERIVAELAAELAARGHAVTVFASGDSQVPCELVPTVPAALRPGGFVGDPSGYLAATVMEVLRREEEFDLIHAHLEWASLPLIRAAHVPIVATLHGRLDYPFASRALAGVPGLVAISRSQASYHPHVAWAGIVHNGLHLEGAPFERRRDDAFVFVGRIGPEKGVVDAIEVARLTGRPLRIAAKLGRSAAEQAYAEEVFRPALGRADAEYLGEISGAERDRLLAHSYALLMPGSWPEPFGLAAIEAMACGAPVIARRAGALPEIVRDGVDGFLADDPQQMAFVSERVPTLDRLAIRQGVLERFSAQRMADGYEAVYGQLLASGSAGGSGGPASPPEALAERDLAQRAAAPWS